MNVMCTCQLKVGKSQKSARIFFNFSPPIEHCECPIILEDATANNNLRGKDSAKSEHPGQNHANLSHFNTQLISKNI